jgi:hypothetical protein
MDSRELYRMISGVDLVQSHEELHLLHGVRGVHDGASQSDLVLHTITYRWVCTVDVASGCSPSDPVLHTKAVPP